MADNQILISAGFDLNELDKQMKVFVTRFRSALNKSLANLKIDLSKLKFDKVEVKVVLDLTQAKKQIDDFRNGLKPLTVTVNAGATPTATPTATKPALPGKTSYPNMGFNPAYIFSQKDLDAAYKSLDRYEKELKDAGLTEKEIIAQTKQFQTALASLQRTLDSVVVSQQRFQQRTGASGFFSFIPSQSQTKKLEEGKIKLEELTQSIGKASVKSAVFATETKRVDHFMESFGFKVGILGFGLGLLGAALGKASQGMIQFGVESAKIIEPLERIRNLLLQDPGTTGMERSFILTELNRLADYPGSNLEQTAKTFRSLQTLGLETAQTLRLLEGLTKATARSGIGAEGLDRIAAQLRDFSSTGELKQQEIRSIISAGGRDVARIFSSQFGGTTSEAINKIAPKQFFKVFADELAKLPQPLETVTDKFNRLYNVIGRIRLAIMDMARVGINNLINALQSLEAIVVKLKTAFDSLSPNTKAFVSNLLVALPIITAGFAALLTVLGALALALATGRHLADDLAVFRTKLAQWTGAATAEVTIFSALMTKFGESVAKVKLLFSGIASGGVLSGLNRIVSILARIVGLTTPLGLALNTIFAYLTDAGSARSIINGAFARLFAALQQLMSNLSTFFTGPVGEQIINTLTAIVNLIGGSLANAVAIVVNWFSRWVELMNELFAFFSNPSIRAFGSLAKSFFMSLAGSVADLGVLMAASFVEAVADLLPKSSINTDAVLPPVPGMEAPRAILSMAGNGGNSLRATAQALRDKVLNRSSLSTQLPTSVDNASLRLEKSLTRSAEAADKFYGSFSQVAQRLGTLAVTMIENNARFLAEFQKSSAARGFSRLIQADVAKAQQGLGDFLGGQGARDISAEQTVFRAKLKEIEDRSTAYMAQLQQKRIPAFSREEARATGLGPYARPQDLKYTQSLIELADQLDKLNRLAASGSIDINEYQKRLNTLVQTAEDVKNVMAEDPLLSKENDNVQRFVTTLQKEAESIGGFSKEYQDLLATTIESTQKIQQSAKQTRADLEEEIQLRIRIIEAERRSFNIQKEIQDIQSKLVLEQERMNALQEAGLEIAPESRLPGIEDELIAAQAQLEAARMSEADELKTIQILNQKILQLKEAQANQERRQVEWMRENVRLGRQATQQSLDLITDLNRQFKDIQTQYVPGVGSDIGASETLITKILATQLAIDTRRINELIQNTRNAFTQVKDSLRGTALEFTNTWFDLLTSQLSNVSTTEFETVFAKVFEDATQEALKLSKESAALREQVLEGVLAGENVDTLIEKQNGVARNEKAIGAILEILNKLYGTRVGLVDAVLQKTLRNLSAAKAELQLRRDTLELEARIQGLRNANAVIQSRQSAVGSLDLAGQEQRRLATVSLEISLIRNRYDLERKELDILYEQELSKLRAKNATAEEIKALEDLIAKRRQLLDLAEELETDNARGESEEDGITEFTNKLQNLTSTLSDETFRNFARGLREAMLDIDNSFKIGANASQLFQDVATTAVTAAAGAIGQAFVQMIVSGDNFLDSVGKLLGQTLIMLGQMLIQMSLAAVAMAFMDGLFKGGLGLAISQAAAVAPMAAIGFALGTGLVIAGTLMGGGSGTTQAASANTTNATNAQTGAVGKEFDPNRDPRTVFQKALMAQIQIDIRTDDTQIVKTVIKHVNQNTRLTKLIGNRKLQFG